MSDMIDRAKAKRAMETLHRTRSGYSGMGCNGYLTLTDATAQIIDAIPAVQVGVKPLEWVDAEDDRGDGTSEHNGGYAADSPIGVYEIAMGFGSDCYYWSVSDPMLNEIGSYEDPIYAKAAAQADYEARIRSALSAQPSPDVVEIDLRAVMMEEIEDAAAQSPWVPPEYTMNEVVSDCCAFLREPRSQSPDVAALVEAMVTIRCAILEALRSSSDMDYCLNLSGLSARTDLPRETLRGIIADMRAEGLVSYHKGLWSEEGTPGGAGYAITDDGRAALARLKGGAGQSLDYGSSIQKTIDRFDDLPNSSKSDYERKVAQMKEDFPNGI